MLNGEGSFRGAETPVSPGSAAPRDEGALVSNGFQKKTHTQIMESLPAATSSRFVSCRYNRPFVWGISSRALSGSLSTCIPDVSHDIGRSNAQVCLIATGVVRIRSRGFSHTASNYGDWATAEKPQQNLVHCAGSHWRGSTVKKLDALVN